MFSRTIRTLFSRIKRPFALHRKKVILVGLFTIILGLVVTQLVSAIREEHVYIFPTHIDVDGWDHPEGELSQDLSAAARASDFNVSNSAFVQIGSTTDLLPVGTSTSDLLTPIASTSPTTTSIIPQTVTSPGESASTTEATMAPVSFLAIPHAQAHDVDPVMVGGTTTLSHTHCAVHGSPCHTLLLAGFTLGGALDQLPYHKADLTISLGGNVTQSSILSVTYSLGDEWKTAGEIPLAGTFGNDTHEGYITLPLPDVASWDDLAKLVVVVEFATESGNEISSSQVFLDSAWIDAAYEHGDIAPSGDNVKSTLSGADQVLQTNQDATLDTGEKTITFAPVGGATTDGLEIRVDHPTLVGLSSGKLYANVRNDSDQDVVPTLSLFAPEGGVSVKSARVWKKGIPETRQIPTHGVTGYFCESGWATSTSIGAGAYKCQSGEIRNCSALNADLTNCIVEGDSVGVKEETVYVDGWQDLSVREYVKPSSLVTLLGNDSALAAIPEGAQGISSVPLDLIIPAHSAVSVELTVALPEDTKGDYYLHALADTGASAVTPLGWDASWTRRIEVDLGNDTDRSMTDAVSRIHIDRTHEDFWSSVKSDGGDIRLVDDEIGEEIPFGVTRFDYDRKEADLWVRLSKIDAHATSTAYVYFGNPMAERVDSLETLLSTPDLSPRAVVVGRDVGAITVDVSAFTQKTHVKFGTSDEVILGKGETRAFTQVHSGETLFSSGPVTAIVSGGDNTHAVVPLSYAGTAFVIPDAHDGSLLSISSVNGNANATIVTEEDATGTTIAIDSNVPHAPLAIPKGYVHVTSDVPIVLSLSRTVGRGGVPIPPLGETFVGTWSDRTSVGTVNDGSSYAIRCATGAGEAKDGRLGGKAFSSTACAGGVFETRDAYLVDHALQPIGVSTEDEGGSTTLFPLTADDGGKETILPFAASKIMVACLPLDRADWEVRTADGTLIQVGNCAPNMAHVEKEVVVPHSGGAFDPGVRVISVGTSSDPLYVFAEEAGEGASLTDERIHAVGGEIASRGYAEPTSLEMHDAELVFPTGHRKDDVLQDGTKVEHTNDLLTTTRDFASEEIPAFRFRFHPQKSALLTGLRAALGMSAFSVEKLTLVHQNLGEQDADLTVVDQVGDEWGLEIHPHGKMHPGKYTIKIALNDNGEIIEDSFDFYWGVLAINTDQSVYAQGSNVNVMAGALSNSGNTVCDARLRLQITRPSGEKDDLDLPPSGFCNGNNVTSVPDYFTNYAPTEVGSYALHLVRIDASGNLLNELSDAFVVATDTPLLIQRTGPTRIYPISPYTMTMKVTATRDFDGDLVEKLPKDFVVIDRGGGLLEDNGDTITEKWHVILKAGEATELTYKFDAPDISPYRFTLGPATLDEGGSPVFSELREWQIASDAAGQMIIMWDDGATVPAGWTCVSCSSGDPFSNRFFIGSTAYGTTTGTTTHTHTATGTVDVSTGNVVTEDNSVTAPLNIAASNHSHTYATPVVSATTTLPRYRTLRYLRSNSAGDVTTMPTGTIAMFDVASSSLPSFWYRYAAQDGYFIYGSTTVGFVGGSSTHTHIISSSTDTSTDGGLRQRASGTTYSAAQVNHQHQVNATTTLTNHEPPYLEMVLAKLATSTAPPNNVITMWTDTPAAGWQILSDQGNVLDQKFVKASTTYGGTGGSLYHIPANLDATTSTTSLAITGRSGVPNNGIGATSTHVVHLSFGDTLNNPPSIETIIAKRLVGVSNYIQQDFWWYANQNAITPGDPWPPGGGDLLEDDPIDTPANSIVPTQVIRLRMNMFVGNATSTAGAQKWKLQYSAAADCTTALNWFDVASTSSSTAPWRGYDNSGVAQHATLPSKLLSSSTVAESYVEENNSTSTAVDIPIAGAGEWDWAIQDNAATANTNYCFRMTKSDGTPLNSYQNYPSLLTNHEPFAPTLVTPFNNEATPTTTPWFEFTGDDTEDNPLDYHIQVDDDPTFASPNLEFDTITNPDLFDNLSNPTNKAPFTTGDLIRYRASSALVNGTTYWWRVQTIDSSGSNTYGPWSSSQSLTINTAVTVARWFQTTSAQFQTDTLDGVAATSSTNNFITLITGSTTGTTTSSAIAFSAASTGTAWGSLSWSDAEPLGSITYRLQYYTSTGTWAYIPNTALAGNSAGFGVSPVSLSGVDPSIYDTIRIEAVFVGASNSGPRLNDWQVDWAFVVNTPTQFTLFDNEAKGTTTPSFEFTTTDPQGDSLTYEFSWSTTTAFTSSTTKSSDTAAGFQNLTTPADTDPFNSGDRVRFTIQAANALTASTTYWWKVRARDPLGSNTWSFWSDPHSFTVNLSVVNPTWFQTTGEQFQTDSLTGSQIYSTTSVQVSTSTGEALIAYGEGTVQTPRYRIWDGANMSAQSSAQSIGSQIKWIVSRSSPIDGSYALGTIGTDKKTKVQIYSGGIWGTPTTIANSVSNAGARGLALGYETLSGKLMAVSCDGDTDPTYKTYSNGSWSSAGTVDLAATSSCEWVRLASNPISNEMILLERNTGSRYEAQVWNGTSWGSTTTLGFMSEFAHEGMAVEYEESGNQALIVASNANSANFNWKAWNGTTWTANATFAIGDDYEWGNLKRDKGTDNMALCLMDNTIRHYLIRWNGAAWQTAQQLDTTDISKHERPEDCEFENTTGRDGFIMAAYADNASMKYRTWDGATLAAEAAVSTEGNGATVDTARTENNQIVAMIFGTSTPRYDFTYWNGATWAAPTTLNSSPSVTKSPYGEPFALTAKKPATSGTIKSSQINFSDGVAPSWRDAQWTATTSGSSTIAIQIEYYTSTGTWALIPNTDLPGNSTGATATSGTLDISNLNTSTYGTIRLSATLTCVLSKCPQLNDWTVHWAAGIDVSGTAKQYDLSTNVTSGTVAVAVDGTLQTGKTGTISGGTWTIPNVTVFPGHVLTVFVQNAATTSRAASVTRYSGPGDIGGIKLNEGYLTIGSASTSATTTTNTDIGLYDNSVSGSSDLFYDVGAGGSLVVGTASGSAGAGLLVNASTFRPNSAGGKSVTTYNLRIDSTLTCDGNTLNVGGNWDNNSAFNADTGTVIFTATSASRLIDSTGAATSSFNIVTFGSGSGSSTWSASSSMTILGDATINFGTLSPNSQAINLAGNLTFGASGAWAKGTATTTFNGSVSKTWTDNTTAKQDIGNILIDGSAKTLTLGSNTKASNITIGTDDTFDASASNYSVTVNGYWNNGNIFNARTGSVIFAGTTTPFTITPGGSSFSTLQFAGGGGAWSFTTANATTTADFTVSTGTVTLPTGTLAVGGSFTNSIAGSFSANANTVKFTSTASGKTVQAGTSTWANLLFSGSGGGWTFADVNATTSEGVTIAAGTVTLPVGTFAIKKSFDNSGGTFNSNISSVLKFTAATSTYNVRGNGSSFGSLLFSGGGSWSFLDTNATTTGDLTILLGTTTFPTGILALNRSFANSDKFIHASGTLKFYATSTGNTITASSSQFGSVEFNSGTGGWTVSSNATSSGNFSILAAGAFTQSSGTTLETRGTFTNLVGGASTTWSGSRLWLNSQTNYTINTKSAGGDAYGIFTTGSGTQARMWNSTSTLYEMASTGSLYSQNHNSVNGELYVFGNYSRTSGTDYWDAATDFDGTVLGTPRVVTVKIAANATTTFTGTSLETIGTSSATTTVTNQGSGAYGIVLSGGTWNGNFYAFRNLGNQGLQLLATTTISAMDHGDFELAVAGGTTVTMSSTTVDRNQSLQVSQVRFATTTAITGFNVTELGTATSSIRFKNHYGNLAGESFDNDPGGNPGNIRWDDSAYVITVSGNVYSDAGVTPMNSPTCDGVTSVVRVKVYGGGSYAAPCTNGTGAYTVSGVTFVGDTVFTVFLDTNGGARAALVTKSANANLTGINLYKDRVIVRHEDVTPMSIADMNAWDSGDDSDIPFTVSTSGPNTLTVRSETEFWVWSGKTFVPGGNITLQSGGSGALYDGKFHLDNNAIFTGGGSETHSIGGGMSFDSGSTFTAGGSTFILTATTTGKIISAVPSITFSTLTASGTGGGWQMSGTYTLQNAFAVNAGTVSGTANITVQSGGISGAGAFAMTGGTVEVDGIVNFGGNTDWSFYGLKFGNGAAATTTKTGSSTITVTNLLTVSASTVLQASNSRWILLGGGTVMTVSGTLAAQTSTFRYASTTAMTVAALPYYRLELRPTGSGSPTYTMQSGSLSVGENLVIGDGTNAVSVTANANDPTLSITGDLTIGTSTTLIGSDSGSFTVGGSWINSGTYTHSGGTVTFNASATGKTILASTSPFSSLTFNSGTGGWTILGNATTSSAFTLTQAGAFTLQSGGTLEVDGTFTNSVGGASTTWTGSVLHLNSGTSYSINTKTSGADVYDTLRVGTSTDVKLWNSSAATTTTLGTGSVYSQNNAGTNGSLNIWGDYTRSSGTEYWDYAKDFDGTDLTGGSERTVNVRLASSSSVGVTGGTWEILGTSTASTTIDTQSSGAYALRLSGGTLNAQYYTVRNIDSRGFDLSGSPTITNISNGDYVVTQGGGTGMTVAASVIDANQLKTFFRDSFATTTGISAYNVTAVGSSTSAWRFNLHYGNLSGERYDNDPGGDPGMLIWDDSAANITISGVVYADSGVTPLGSPTCDGSTLNVRLKVQGAGTYTSACNASTGAYSISGVIFNPGDTLTVYLDTNGGARGATVSVDPATNVPNMDIYRNTVIVRHEGLNAMTIAAMDQYDNGNDSDIPFTATLGSPNTLSVLAGTELRVWNTKTFAPGGNVTVYANASSTDNRDGSLVVESNAIFTAAGTETHTFGGKFTVSSGATFTAANSSVVMNATTTGKTISPNTSPFYNLSFTGGGGAWSFSGVATTTNNFTSSNGAVTLPSTTLAVGGSFSNASPASFVSNGGTVKFTSTATGKTIQAGTSTWANLLFSGSGGGWTFSDTNATSSATVTIALGTVTMPVGTFAIDGSFVNSGGIFTQNQSAAFKMTATNTPSTVTLGGSSAGNLLFTGGGSWTMADTNATTTGSLRIISGTTTLPTGVLEVRQSFVNSDKFTHASGTVKMTGTTTGYSITAGNSQFGNLELNNSGGGWTVTGNATTSGTFSILAATAFTQASGSTFETRGTFTNLVGGAATTWTGSRLAINNGSSNYTINTKAAGGDAYNILEVGPLTQLRSWNSSASTYEVSTTGSLYSQNHAGVSGDLYIFGNYVRTSGTDYWSYATDFDGTALGGSSRAVTVRHASGATSTYTNASLQVIGISTASTTITNQGSGLYNAVLNSSTLNANFYAFRNLATSGLQLLGASPITSMQNGDFELAVGGGTLITVASSTIDQNASSFISRVRFATTTTITGRDVTRTGTSSSAITFQSHYGNLSGENFDDDGGDGCGQIRFDDSSCLFVDQSHYRWRNDDGGEGVPASEWYDVNWSKRRRVTITNPNASTVTNADVKFTVAYDSDMQASWNDIRFTDSSGTTTIPFWFEAANTSATSTAWVKIPSLPSGQTTVYMYYGNNTAPSAGSGTSTFAFFDDFEDGNITEYTGDTSLFSNLGTMNQERTYGLGASTGNESSQNTSGIGQVSAGIGRDTTIRYFQYVNAGGTANDESCFLFGIQSPITSHSNYGVCAELPGLDKLALSKNVAYNSKSGGATEIGTSSVTWTTGWYETKIDWLSTANAINVNVYDANGNFFASTTASSSLYTSGGIGFTFWGQHGGWDIPMAYPYMASAPTAAVGPEQINSGASWKTTIDTILANQLPSTNVRLRFQVKNSGGSISNQNFKLQVADKGASPNCESVPTGNFANVPTTSGAGCGSSYACMTSSSQFSDHASTTDQLSVPSGFTFTPGEIMKDPSNQSNNQNMSTNFYSEMEYNFQVTAYATGNSYCFRTANGNTPLDNYSHVAELTVRHPPTISNYQFNGNANIALVEGATTSVTASGTITDFNGYTDIAFATSTFYRSGLSSGRWCAANDNNCYQVASTSCSLSNCSGNSCNFMCTAAFQYFADPTDAGSPNAAEVWQAYTDVTDYSQARDTGSSTQELLTLRGFAASSTIGYGSVTVGQNTGAFNPTTTIRNTGNVILNLLVSGTDMTNASSSIAAANQKYATSTFTYSSCTVCSLLSTTSQAFALNLTKPTTTAPFSTVMYWGVNVPLGTAAATHSGQNTLIGN